MLDVQAVIFYALFVSGKDTNLPLGIIDVIFFEQNVSF